MMPKLLLLRLLIVIPCLVGLSIHVWFLYEQYTKGGLPVITYEEDFATRIPGFSICLPFPSYVPRKVIHGMVEKYVNKLAEDDRECVLAGLNGTWNALGADCDPIMSLQDLLEIAQIPALDVFKLERDDFSVFTVTMKLRSGREKTLYGDAFEDYYYQLLNGYFIESTRCFTYRWSLEWSGILEEINDETDQISSLRFHIQINQEKLRDYGVDGALREATDLFLAVHDSFGVTNLKDETMYELRPGTIYKLRYSKNVMRYWNGREDIHCYDYEVDDKEYAGILAEHDSDTVCRAYHRYLRANDGCELVNIKSFGFMSWLNRHCKENGTIGDCKRVPLTATEEKDLCPLGCHQIYFELHQARRSQQTSSSVHAPTHVHIKPTTHPTLVVRYQAKITLVEFLSQLGGIMGIWFGISAFGTLDTFRALSKGTFKCAKICSKLRQKSACIASSVRHSKRPRISFASIFHGTRSTPSLPLSFRGSVIKPQASLVSDSKHTAHVVKQSQYTSQIWSINPLFTSNLSIQSKRHSFAKRRLMPQIGTLQDLLASNHHRPNATD